MTNQATKTNGASPTDSPISTRRTNSSSISSSANSSPSQSILNGSSKAATVAVPTQIQITEALDKLKTIDNFAPEYTVEKQQRAKRMLAHASTNKDILSKLAPNQLQNFVILIDEVNSYAKRAKSEALDAALADTGLVDGPSAPPLPTARI